MIDAQENIDAIGKQQLLNGVELIQTNKVVEGMQVLAKIVMDTPNCDFADDAIYYMGLTYLKNNKLAKAYNAFLKLVKEYPNSNVYRYAKLRLDKLVEQKDVAAELFYKGENLFRFKDYHQAIKVFEELKSKYPKSVLVDNACLYQALIYQNLDAYEPNPKYKCKANELFQLIIDKYPESDAADFIRTNRYHDLCDNGIKPKRL